MQIIDLIKDIIARFGPRPAGSEAELQAQRYILSKCLEHTDNARYLEFEDHLDARFGKLKYYVVMYFAALVLFHFSKQAAVLVAALNVLVLMLDLMMYRDVLTTFPGKRKVSANVDATLEPEGEARQTILISGHMDSTLEYTWWYRLGQWGIVLTILAGVLMALQFIFLVASLIIQPSLAYKLWWVFLALSPITWVYWDMYGKEAVPGAQDNLSGIAIAYTVFSSLANPNRKGYSVLQNTRIRFVSFGSEEKGLVGSRAYVRAWKDELKQQNAHLINIDGVRLVSEIGIVEKEQMNGARHHASLVQGLLQSFKHENIACKKVGVPFGGTDAVSFTRVGIPALTIIGMSATEYDFTYHTRHDVVENIEPQSLELVAKAIQRFIKDSDK